MYLQVVLYGGVLYWYYVLFCIYVLIHLYINVFTSCIGWWGLWIFGGNYNSLPIATTHRITRDTDSKTLYIFDYHNIDYDDDDEKI